jgi:uncharacterized protein (TIGR02300 family)
MTKQELGTKRLCAHCDAKFYDLNHSPITCPKCGTVFEIAPLSSRFGLGPARAPMPEGEPETAESNEVQLSSLEDAETTEGEEDAVETDDASLNDAALIDNIEEDEAEVIDVIEDDEDDR